MSKRRGLGTLEWAAKNFWAPRLMGDSENTASVAFVTGGGDMNRSTLCRCCCPALGMDCGALLWYVVGEHTLGMLPPKEISSCNVESMSVSKGPPRAWRPSLNPISLRKRTAYALSGDWACSETDDSRVSLALSMEKAFTASTLRVGMNLKKSQRQERAERCTKINIKTLLWHSAILCRLSMTWKEKHMKAKWASETKITGLHNAAG